MQKHPQQHLEFVQKAFNFEPVDIDVKDGVVTGYFASFGEIDRDNDMIMPGAFSESIALRGPGGTKEIKHLLQHSSHKPLGNIVVLKEDVRGLYFETKFTTGVDYVDATLLQYANKVYNNHSIGFRYEELDFIEDDPLRGNYWQVTKMKLWEGSTVTWGANPNTPFEGFKNMSGPAINAHFTGLYNRLSGCRSALKGTMTDGTAQNIEQELMKVESELKHSLALLPQIINSSKKQIPTPSDFDALDYINNK